MAGATASGTRPDGTGPDDTPPDGSAAGTLDGTGPDTDGAGPAPRRVRWHRLPVVRQLRQSVGLQRGMLVAGLALTGLFVLAALLAPLIAPYGFGQVRDSGGNFGAQDPPSGRHWLGTTVGGFDVLSRVLWGSRTALLVIVVAVVISLVVG